jgi:hypothetical protein
MVMRLKAGWLTVDEAMARTKLSRGGIRGAMDNNILPFDWITKSIRVIHEEDIAVYMRDHRGRYGGNKRRSVG